MRFASEHRPSRFAFVAVILCVVAAFTPRARSASSPPAAKPQSQSQSTPEQPQQQLPPGIFLQQPFEDAKQKTDGCMSCHTSEDSPTMHKTGSFALGCTDCHGGNAKIFLPPGTAPNS